MNVSDIGVSSALTSVRAIHQFHPSVAQGDAITDNLIAWRKVFRSWGFQSQIYSQSNYPDISAFSLREYDTAANPNNMLLLHFSIAYEDEVLRLFESLPDAKIAVYHNITPAHYFKGINSLFEQECSLGRRQLPRLARLCRAGIGDSKYNCNELDRNGFEKTYRVPIMVDFGKFKSSPATSIISKYRDRKTNILFVGRIYPNKRHDALIKAFACYQRIINPSSRLFLIGQYKGAMEEYLSRLKDLVKTLKCEEVYFMGHVSHAELIAYYSLADIFLCLSDHEGFCVPLLESMFFRIPVIAYRAGAVPEILNGAGVLVEDQDPLTIAETIDLLSKQPDLRKAVLQRQDRRLREFTNDKVELLLREALIGSMSSEESRTRPLSVCIEGTFEDSYSLSIVNRNLGLALDEEGVRVNFYATGRPGDYIPRFNMQTKPRVKELWQRMTLIPDVSIRNTYPLCIDGMRGRYRFVCFAWEETKIPDSWVSMFNQLDGVFAISNYVKGVLLSCGVTSPIRVIPLGIDFDLNRKSQIKIPITTNKKFIFLNVSSAFPRKGLDILFDAYFNEFNEQDDVCLIIKSFPNIHNRTREILGNIKKKHSPEVHYIEEENMPPETLISLYQSADCFVSPTRGEGFGLPVAEAMFYKVPVIVTDIGGHRDYCDSQTAILIPSKLVQSQSHLAVPGSLWAEPSVKDLQFAMRRVYEEKTSPQINEIVEAAYRKVVTFCDWKASARKVISFIDEIIDSTYSLAMVTTWDQRCGIAEYSRYLLSSLPRDVKPVIFANRLPHRPDEEKLDYDIIRCWDQGSGQEKLIGVVEMALRIGVKVVHFQFNFGFYDPEALAIAVERLHKNGIKVLITFHAVHSLPPRDEQFRNIAHSFLVADRILVHTDSDRNYLVSLGLDRNVRTLPHGHIVFDMRPKNGIRSSLGMNSDPIIATFGFLLEHKGILEIIRAIGKLKSTYPDILFIAVSSLYPSPESDKYLVACREEIERLNLERGTLLFTDYLSSIEISHLLQSADLIALPYKETKESSSAAIRFALAAQRPVLVTDLPIFSEFKDEVFKIRSTDPDVITEGIRAVLSSPEEAEKRVLKAKAYVQERTWDKVAKQYVSMLEEIREGRTEGSG